MKKNILLLMALFITLPVVSQTEFHNLSFQDALSLAKKEKKMVFIDFFTDWCGPCKKMSKDVFPLKSVGEYMNHKFICLKINAEKEGKDLAKRFEVKAYPTFIILNPKEEVIFELKGSMSGDDFIEKIESGLDPEKSPAVIARKYQSGDRSPEVVNRYAFSFMEKGKENEGFEIINSYFKSLSDKERLKKENAFLFLRYTLDLNDEKGQFMAKNISSFDSSIKSKMEDKLKILYHSSLITYFSGYMFVENKYDEATYLKLKNEIHTLGYDKIYEYKPMFDLIECYSLGDKNAYLNLCEKLFPKLNSKDKDMLIMNLTRLIKTEDKTMLKRMSSFIRERLAVLSPGGILLSGRLLGSIEEKM